MSRDALDRADSTDKMALTLIPLERQLHFGIGFWSNTMSVAALANTATNDTISANHSHAQ